MTANNKMDSRSKTKIFHRLKQFFGNMSIQTKLLLSMLSLFFCAVLMLGIYFYYVSANSILDNSKKYIQNTMNQVGKNLDYNIKTVEDILFDLSTNKELQEDINIMNKKNLAEYEKAQLGIEIKNLMIMEITKLKDITAVYLVSLDGEMFSARQESYNNPNVEPKEIYDKKGSNLWMKPDYDLHVVPIGKAVYSLSNQKPLGYLVMYVDISYFEKVFEDISFSELDQIFVCNNEKQVLFGAERDVLQQKISGLTFPKNFIQTEEMDGAEKQVCNAQILEAPWMVVSISEGENYNPELINLRSMTIGVMTAVLFLIAVLVILISRGITKPVKKLALSMEKFSKGDFSVHANVKYNDEIGKLRKSFNNMVSDMDELVNKVYQERNLKQQAQLHALQMQINPHFLYNTLDTINWLSIAHGAQDVSEVTRSLGVLMRFSLKKEEKVSFEEELDAVENYIRIQKYRYGEELKIDIQVEEEALYEKVPRHIILPMIENAIEHGFADKITDKQIKVTAFLQEGIMHIEVRDNGIGMSEEVKNQIIQILNGGQEEVAKEQEKQHMSIGLQNVQKRIKLHYGELYGLTMESKQGEGTGIQIHIPIETLDEIEDNEEIEEREEELDEI